MISFLHFWITSWLSNVWSLHTIFAIIGLYSTAVNQTKFTANSHKFISQYDNLRQISSQQLNQKFNFSEQQSCLPIGFSQLAFILPSQALNLNKSTVNTPNTSIKAINNKPNYWSSVDTIISPPSLWRSLHILLPITLFPSSIHKLDIAPNQILRSLQDFLLISVKPAVVSPHLSKLTKLTSHFTSNSPPHLINYPPSSSLMMVVNQDEQSYQVWVNHKFVAYIPDESAVNLLKQRLRQLATLPRLDANQLRPALVDGTPSLMIGNRFFFGVDQHISNQLNQSADLLAIEWINNLRIALKATPLSLVEGQMQMYGLRPSEVKFSGIASWYGQDFNGRLTANGEIYHQVEFTVAHRSLPFNTYLLVRNLQNGRSVIVRVNDRGPYILPRSLDLSTQAAISINSDNVGVVPYEAVVLQPNPHKKTIKPFIHKNEPVINEKIMDFN